MKLFGYKREEVKGACRKPLNELSAEDKLRLGIWAELFTLHSLSALECI